MTYLVNRYTTILPRTSYSLLINYSDKEFDAEVEKIAIEFPYCGENFIKQILVQKGIKVQRMRIRESIGLTMMQSMPEKKEDYTDVIIT